MPSEISQNLERQILYDVSPTCGIYKVELIKERVDDVWPHGLGGREMGRCWYKRKNFNYAEWINSGDLMHSIMIQFIILYSTLDIC